MSVSPKVVICAVEPSGDALGSALAAALQQRRPDIELSGCGGPAMAAQGIDSLFDISVFSVMGVVDAVKALPAAQRAARTLGDHVRAIDADAVVLIDSWAFSSIAAKAIRKAAPQTKLIKYVAPQVWASRPERAKKLARLFDGVITLFDFEPAWFEPHGAKATAAGHPGFQALMASRGGGADFRLRHGMGKMPLVILAPGSRRMEIDHLAPRFRDAMDRLREEFPDLRVAVPVAPGRDEMVAAAFADWDAAPVLFGSDEKAAAFDAADAALVASGTLSTEMAIAGTPMVVGYRFDAFSAAWGRAVVTSRWASLVNIAMDETIIPEFIQEKCEPYALAKALGALLRDENARARQISAFPAALERLGAHGSPAGEKAADIILSWIGTEI